VDHLNISQYLGKVKIEEEKSEQRLCEGRERSHVWYVSGDSQPKGGYTEREREAECKV
jgi:hypothetical protein